jgi:hypothetical protein
MSEKSRYAYDNDIINPKGRKQMKKKLAISLGLLFGAFMSYSVEAKAIPTVIAVSTGASVTGYINASYSFTLATKSFAGVLTPGLTMQASGFPTYFNTWTANNLGYVELKINDNWAAWDVQIYTNNFHRGGQDGTAVVPSTATWGFSLGSMISSVQPDSLGRKLPIAWSIRNEAGLAGPLAAIPSADVAGSSWTFVQDKSDMWDSGPNFGVLGSKFDETTNPGAFGYRNVMFGNPSSINLCGGDMPSGIFRSGTSPVAVMLAAGYPAASGTYTTKVYFDLYHE